MQKFLVFAAIALFATTLALPVVEDSWDVEDELLQRVHEDATPLSLMQVEGNKDTVAAAEAKKEENAKAAKAAGATEKEWTKKEKEFQGKAAKLAKDQHALEAADKKAAAEAAEKYAKDSASAAKKMEGAIAATKKAEAANKEMQAKTKTLLAKLKAEGGKADEATKARLKKYEEEMAKNKKDIASENAKREQIKKDQADLKKSHHDEMAKIKGEYAAKSKKIASDLEEHTKKLNAEAAKYAGEYKAAMEKNAKTAADKKKQLDAEAKKNEADAKAAQAEITKKYAALAATRAKAEAMYHKAEAEKAKALSEKRAATAKATAEKAAKIEAAYQKLKNGPLKKEQEDADAAKATAKAAVAKAKKDAAAAKVEMDKEDDADAETKSCAMDGSQCMTKDEKCHPANQGKKGDTSKYYLDKDLVHCTTTRPKVIVGSDAESTLGNDWAGIGTTATPTPAPASAACVAAKKAWAADKKWGKKWMPSQIACSKGKQPVVRAALSKFLAMAEICPTVCNDSTGQTVSEADGQSTTNAICVTADDFKGYKEQVDDIPVYKKSGTNGRFKAGLSVKVCRLACSAEKGWAEGAGASAMPGSDAACK